MSAPPSDTIAARPAAAPLRASAPAWLWLFVAYTLVVILWGAWVRISHSGDGCGESWPLCHGEFIPSATQKKTWVEFTHRMMSGAFGLFVLGIWIWVRRRWPLAHPARKAATAALILTVTEALLGAKLVLFGLVGANTSGLRVFVMGLHFLNSAALMASLTLLALFVARPTWTPRTMGLVVPKSILRRLPTITLIGLIALGVTGTFAALSTTLFPSLSLMEGLQKDLSPQSHFLLQLRALHPTLGVFAGVAFVLLFLIFAETCDKTELRVRRASYTLAALLGVTVVVGTVTLLWLSPVPLRLLHLGLAHSIVITFTAWIHSLRYKIEGP